MDSSQNEKAIFWARILSKITTLQQNANWFTLHIIIIFRSSRPLRVWAWKPFRGSSCRKCLCVSSDGRGHSFLCSCNVFGRIMSPQNGISFTSLTGFRLWWVSCDSRHSGNTMLSFFIYMTTSSLNQASLGLSV